MTQEASYLYKVQAHLKKKDAHKAGKITSIQCLDAPASGDARRFEHYG